MGTRPVIVRAAFFAVLLALLAGCETSTHVIVGSTRAPILPEDVRLYLTPPAKYDTIALVTAEGKPSWAFTYQQQMDVAIERLKSEAAKLGANGILLEGAGDRYMGSLGSGVASIRGFSAIGLAASMPAYIKEAKGVAIYVKQK